MMRPASGHWFIGLLLYIASTMLFARDGGPQLAVIIDDLGDNRPLGQRAVDLPAVLTCSILPHTPFARYLAERAHSTGKEVMLHQPMAAVNHTAMGPGGLGLSMTETAFLTTLRHNLASVPHVKGINNHMGSLLTRHPGHMTWLMRELARRGNLYFVDSLTTAQSIAIQIADEQGLLRAERNIFLDSERHIAAIAQQMQKAVLIANKFGSAITIGHPYPETLAFLEETLPHLQQQGIKLVKVSELIRHQTERRPYPWQVSSYPSPRDVKSSKQ